MSKLCFHKVDPSPLVSGNQVTLLQSGEAFFSALETAFGLATHDIYLETYIFKNDAVGSRIATALKLAAQRGVQVHLLIDGFGSQKLPQSMLDDLSAAGVRVAWYRKKISPWTFKRKRLRRLHRKIAVVDNKTAFVGGINISDGKDSGNVNTPEQTYPRYDFAVVVEGPLVAVIHTSAWQLWLSKSCRNPLVGRIRKAVKPVSQVAVGSMRAAFLVRDNFRHRRDIEAAYMRAIEGAKFEIIIANAYFLPGSRFRQALLKASARGVRVALLLQGRVEYFLQHYATRALYNNLLLAGIEIYEYQKSYMHAKVAVIDGQWATVGSSNLDPYSMLLSREANIIVEDGEFAGILKQNLEEAMATGALRILSGSWKHQSPLSRFTNGFSYGFVRLLVGISGYDDEICPAESGERSRINR